jgi:hypothetical protein
MEKFDLDDISQFVKEPEQKTDFNTWVKQEVVLPFLEREIKDENIIIYAALPFGFIHAVLIPKVNLNKSIIDDLLQWSHNPYDTWGLTVFAEDAWIEGPLENSGSKTLAKGEQIIFGRSFYGVESRRNYFELEEKISHVLELHYMAERNAWCRLDKHGDFEDVVKVIELKDLPNRDSGTIITFNKKALGKYAGIGNFKLCRMYDFTRFRRGDFFGWRGEQKPVEFGNKKDIFGKLAVSEGYGSYSRGIQVQNIAVPKQKIIDDTWGKSKTEKEKKYATFIAFDFKNKRVAEISCGPRYLASYFEESHLPFQTTPAFFKPEVLLKYKSDREKYDLQDGSISCRGSWYLDTYDVNEAGQVHTYLCYLGNLPYEEQLHWKQYNEHPKGSISKRALATDFKGEWYNGYDPIYSIKQKLDSLDRANVGWWKLRGKTALTKPLYPYTSSSDEWADEILNLDQLVVEGFEERWLRNKAVELGRKPDIKLRELKLAEECLIGLGFEPDHAYKIMSPFHVLHNLRSVLKAHPTGEEATAIRKQALKEFGTVTKHYTDICKKCDESLTTIIEAFRNLK